MGVAAWAAGDLAEDMRQSYQLPGHADELKVVDEWELDFHWGQKNAVVDKDGPDTAQHQSVNQTLRVAPLAVHVHVLHVLRETGLDDGRNV